MNDLIVAYATMLVLSTALAFLAGAKLYPTTRDGVILWLTLAVVAMFAYALNVAGQLYLAKYVPSSASIIWTNIAPLLAGLASGWALRLPNIPKVRRIILSGLLYIGMLVALFWPHVQILLRPPPEGNPSPIFGAAYQSAPATCSPAAATTLLRYEGIEASEAEMIPLCLTEAQGTPTLGLYRGVKLKADAAGREVEIVQATLDELLEQDDWPTLLTVKLPNTVSVDPRYETEWGWIPGMGHSVVALRKTSEDGVVVADPAAGIETWSRHDLETLWHGEGLRLRGDSPEPIPGSDIIEIGKEPWRDAGPGTGPEIGREVDF